MPQDGLRGVLVVDALPLAEDCYRAEPAAGDRLALPGAGELGLGRGQDLVALPEELDEGGGEEVLKGVDRIPPGCARARQEAPSSQGSPVGR